MNFLNYDGDWGITLYIIPIVCSLCFSLSLFIKNDRTLPQAYLAATLLYFGLGMLLCFIYDRYLIADSRETMRTVDLSVTVIGGVFIMTYFISLMHPRRLTRRYFTFYITAALTFSLLMLIADLTLDHPPLGIQDALAFGHPSIIVSFAGETGIAFWECYVAGIIISMYIRHRRFIRQRYSYRERIDLQWLVWCIALFAIFSITTLLRIFDTGVPMKIIFNIVAMVTITCIYILGFRQDAIPTVDDLTNIEEKEEMPEDDDTVYLNRQQEKLFQIEAKLKSYFAEQKPYLNPELSLSDVARAIGVNTTYLSQVMNRQLNINFFTFVNRYRIDHSINLIKTYQGDVSSNLLCIESGFKSKSVFYKLFRERTGFSPQEYVMRRKAKE
jgi:AraC-like DNA-binding protein